MAKGIQKTDGKQGVSFKPFSRGETLSFNISLKTADPNPLVNTDPENPTVFLDHSTSQVFVSLTDVNADSCADLSGDPDKFAEVQLTYIGTDTVDSDQYWFSGKITDEQTIQLPEGEYAVMGTVKVVFSSGDSSILDKALITVYPCGNSRLDQV